MKKDCGSENKRNDVKDVILKVEGNVIYVDFALKSIVNSVDEWFEKYYQGSYPKSMSKAHNFHVTRFYDRKRFSDHTTIGEERDKFLKEVDNYVQMRRDD